MWRDTPDYRAQQLFYYLLIKSMNRHEYALSGITQQDSTIQCGPLATAGQNIATYTGP